MALPEELDRRLEQRLALVETPEYEGEQMDRRDYVSVLLLCALLPGTPHVLPLAKDGYGAVAGVARHGLARDLATYARRADGITTVRVRVGAGTVRATAATPLRDHSGLADKVRTAVDTRLADVELARTPRLRVHVVPDRSAR